MKKIYSTKSTLLTGTLFLTLAGILTRIIGFFYRIFLSRTIGAEGLGIYQLIAPVTAICFAFTAAGIQTSISKFVSMEVGRKNDAGAKTYLSIGLFISLCLSTLCSFFLYHYADFIAVSWLGDKRCTKVFTIDKTTGDIISLSDLFKNKPEMLTAISDNIKEQMKQQMAADSSVTYFIDSDMPEWDFKELKGDESFYFNEKGELVITFDETEVAPAYMGAVEFTIPQSVTGDLK